jgi:hypothetical protein
MTYDFLASYRQFKYYTNPEDLTLFTNNYSFDSTIGRGVLLLSVFPREDIKFNFGYNLVQRTGDALVPRPFPSRADLDERSNDFCPRRLSIGISTFSSWITELKNKNEIAGPSSPKRGRAPIRMSARSRLHPDWENVMAWTERSFTPTSGDWDFGHPTAHPQGSGDHTPTLGNLG